MLAQGNVAQDITEQIPATDVEFALQIVADCLADNSPGVISEFSAHSSRSGQSLHIMYAWHEDGEGRHARYSAQFWRESPEDEWQLSEIIFRGEQRLSGENQPIHFIGFLIPETMQALLESATELWTASTADPFEIVGIASNQMPPMYCETEYTKIDVSDIIYDVTIRNLSPRKRQPPKAVPNTVTLGSYSSNDNSYSIRLTRGSRQPPISTEVDCLGGGVCDPDLLSRLRENLDRPIDPSELENRLQAAFAVLPDEYRDAEVKDTQLSIMGAYEHFSIQLEEVAVSAARRESSSIICRRYAGSREDWHCHQMLMSARQVISGQSSPVSLMLFEALSETDVEDIVRALRSQLSQHPDIGPTDGDIRFFSMHASEQGFKCLFLNGRAIFNATFDYDGDEVRLDSVELITTPVE